MTSISMLNLGNSPWRGSDTKTSPPQQWITPSSYASLYPSEGGLWGIADFDVDALETIYHRDFHTTLVMPDSTVATYNKEGFIARFREQKEEGKTRLNPWADWHDFLRPLD